MSTQSHGHAVRGEKRSKHFGQCLRTLLVFLLHSFHTELSREVTALMRENPEK